MVAESVARTTTVHLVNPLWGSTNKGLSPFHPASLDQWFRQHLRLDEYSRPGQIIDYPPAVALSCLVLRDATVLPGGARVPA